MNENLTPQIVAALLQDGTCKLTKAQMTAAVSAAVANLPKAYVFGGVAQPGLAPGSIPAPTLFVAVAVGTYGSFSNQSVDVGQIVFFTSDDGGAWTRIEVYSATQAAIDAAVAAALEALGPVPKVIVSTADWALISVNGVSANTKAEAAEIAGISEEELDLMLDSGAYKGAVLFAYKAGDEACTAIVKRSYDPDDGQSHAYCNMAGWHNLFLEFQPNYGYVIFGAGREG